jgi:uncharacterized small protein (DUF1192 family)
MLTVNQITFPAKEIKAKEETQSLSKGRGLRHSWESPENSESDFTPGKKKRSQKRKLHVSLLFPVQQNIHPCLFQGSPKEMLQQKAATSSSGSDTDDQMARLEQEKQRLKAEKLKKKEMKKMLRESAETTMTGKNCIICCRHVYFI